MKCTESFNCPKSKILLKTFYNIFFIECDCNGNVYPSSLYSRLIVRNSQYTGALFSFLESLESYSQSYWFFKTERRRRTKKVISDIFRCKKEIAPFLYGIYPGFSNCKNLLQMTKENLHLIKKEEIAIILSVLSTSTIKDNKQIVSYWANCFDQMVGKNR